MLPTVDAPIHLAWPAGRPRPRHRPRRRVRSDLRHAGISAWGWTLFCVTLAIIAWQLPFYRPPTGDFGRDWLDVPHAHHGVDLELGPSVVIDAAGVTLDGRRMATTDEILAHGVDALLPLETDLETMHRNWSILHPRDPFPGTVLIVAPPDTRWAILHPVLMRTALADYPNASFVVDAEPVEPSFEWSRFESTEAR
jgi:hypothetical protein